jgi:hypothetical protein
MPPVERDDQRFAVPPGDLFGHRRVVGRGRSSSAATRPITRAARLCHRTRVAPAPAMAQEYQPRRPAAFRGGRRVAAPGGPIDRGQKFPRRLLWTQSADSTATHPPRDSGAAGECPDGGSGPPFERGPGVRVRGSKSTRPRSHAVVWPGASRQSPHEFLAARGSADMMFGASSSLEAPTGPPCPAYQPPPESTDSSNLPGLPV